MIASDDKVSNPLRTKIINNKLCIWDRLRNKYVVLTPEEGVRQRFTSHLIDNLGYPASLMGNEISLDFNGMHRRCDTLIVNREGNPLVIVEYKSPKIPITQAVFNQIARYNMVMRAKCLIVTNGVKLFCCQYSTDGNSFQFIDHIPGFEELV